MASSGGYDNPKLQLHCLSMSHFQIPHVLFFYYAERRCVLIEGEPRGKTVKKINGAMEMTDLQCSARRRGSV